MRIAHVNEIAYVGSTIVAGLRERGTVAQLIEPVAPGAGIAYPWKAATLPIRAAGLLAAGLELRLGRFDLVHVHYARLGFLGPLAGRPYALHCHGTDVRGVVPDSAWGRELAPLLRRAALVYYATPDLRPWVERFRGDAVFLPNPIPVPPATALEEQARDLLVGVRLNALKGEDRVRAILAGVLAARPATTVTVVDLGEPLAAVLAIAPQARIVPRVAHDAMPALLRSHRVAIGQQRLGAIGNYELEAMAAGLPIAAVFRHADAYPAPPPLLDDEAPERVAERIVELLDNEPARLAVGAAGSAWVRANHDPSVVVDRLLADYASLVPDR